MEYSDLPWNFEAFRRFITFSSLQNASSIIVLFNGINTSIDAKKFSEFQKLLNDRSGITWEPSRQNSEDVTFNTEGNVFRNKARVLSSLYLLNPFALKNDGIIQATDFCKALASGKISEKQYFEFIISNFKYPHPAYDDNWTAWKDKGLELKPFIFILSILLGLYRKSSENAYISTDEFARFGHANPFQANVGAIVDEILNYRSDPSNAPQRTRSDKIDRKINDLFGFLCLSELTAYDGSKIILNLIRRDPNEMTYFYIQRNGNNVIDGIQQLIDRS